MPKIVEFTRKKPGYSGRIRALDLNLDIAIVMDGKSDTETLSR